ncbi:MAG: hypothetical protein UU47_C0025G0009 [candidate division TM6 bacterium GW2011_GWE2_41_16]|nr:MAG: hypothetical protein UU47_C0025G0009 [candidate division TM6 bacterium GW2011_GWE2_41_16]
MTIFLKSLLFALSLSAIIGPTSMFCIQKTLSHGLRRGLIIGLASALIQAIYAIIASLGIGFLAEIFTRYQIYIKIFGGLFLIYFGFMMFKKASRTISCAQISESSPCGDFLTTIGVSIINPIIILMFFSFFTGLAISEVSYLQTMLVASGIFIGSMTWWICFSFLLSLVRTKFSVLWISRINKLSGIIISLMGLWNIIKIFVQ